MKEGAKKRREKRERQEGRDEKERKGGEKRRSKEEISCRDRRRERATWNGAIGEGTAGRGRQAVEKPWLKGFGRGIGIHLFQWK